MVVWDNLSPHKSRVCHCRHRGRGGTGRAIARVQPGPVADRGDVLQDQGRLAIHRRPLGKPLASRAAGAVLLARARKEKPVVVVAKFDRLFRSVADAAATIADFDRKGIELVAIAEGFDMTNPYGRAMAQMASVFAELERAMIRERTKAALKVKRTRGERISRYVPFGWTFGAERRLVENAEEQEAIALMRRLREEGMSYRTIAAELQRRGILPKRGAQWIHTTVKGILSRAKVA
ncbi:MAG: recombinase family protein [Gemmataceae bacterium]